MSAVSGVNSANALIAHRREIEGIRRRIANRRLQVIGLWGTPVAFFLILFSWVAAKWAIWPHGDGCAMVGAFYLSLLSGGDGYRVTGSAYF
ncbi:hypothetical protein QKW45_04065 [Streptomyces sp. AJ-1]|uniref:hypothetical protein n=1 Tax=Streptomyces sp. AJ-1 TaxID=3044384 RepID=UPI00249A286D|nr:hypothetical protein [Streptomyces sp. AJ-1]MDI3342892.1 hypothetical protein [Streptomyces sp. AJ-1]